jgi:hypothetical protein
LAGWRGIAVHKATKRSASRTEQSSPSENVPVPARLAARLSLVNVKRAVSRDGRWSPDSGDSFAKIHSGLVVDASMLAASDRDVSYCTMRAKDESVLLKSIEGRRPLAETSQKIGQSEWRRRNLKTLCVETSIQNDRAPCSIYKRMQALLCRPDFPNLGSGRRPIAGFLGDRYYPSSSSLDRDDSCAPAQTSASCRWHVVPHAGLVAALRSQWFARSLLRFA